MVDSPAATKAEPQNGLERRIQSAMADRDESEQRCRKAEQAAAESEARAETLEAQLRSAHSECARLRDENRAHERAARSKVVTHILGGFCKSLEAMPFQGARRPNKNHPLGSCQIQSRPHTGSPIILTLTCRIRGSNPSNLERKEPGLTKLVGVKNRLRQS